MLDIFVLIGLAIIPFSHVAPLSGAIILSAGFVAALAAAVWAMVLWQWRL
jgi:hypothetical protein